MIVFVVLLHATESYGTITSWWYVWDAVTATKFFDCTVLIIDVFAMPVLFFIAGYFALPDIRKKGTAVFLKGKFIRLGIPWLIGVTFLVPIISYIYQYKHLGGQPLLSYGHFWINWIKTASDFHTGYRYASDIVNFGHSVYWFISLLLFFFIVFGLIYTLKKRLLPSVPIQEKTQSGKTMLLVMLLVGILCVFIFRLNAIIPVPYPDPWVYIVNILQFQSWRLPVYIIYFALGIYAFSRNWFVKDNNFPGHPLLWMSICIILCFGYVVNLNNLIANQTNIKFIIIYVWLFSFLRMTFLILFMSVAVRYWNRPHKINETLAANSYNIYLVHLPLVIVLQLLLFNLMGIPSLLKFGIVFSLSFLISYALSRYAIKPHPRLSIVAVVVIFFLMVLFVYPRA
jgi:hypothetical protein